MRRYISFVSVRTVLLLVALAGGPTALYGAEAAQVVLAADGRCEYQVVVPDAYPSDAIASCLRETARLVQAAFQANRFDLAVVSERDRDAAQPAVFLGNTRFARRHDVVVSKLEGWGYVLKAVGRDLIIAGRDEPSPVQRQNRRRGTWDRIGTAKGVVDFLRDYCGVRFLYPELPAFNPVSGAAQIDWHKTPALEFLPRKTITVPADLNLENTPWLSFNTAHPARGSFYDLAMNRFPRVDEAFGGHTYWRAIPPEKYRQTHPEYFALIRGKRLLEGSGQYCISNPDVQELIYRDLVRLADSGYRVVDLAQPDGFRPCQCKDCNELYGTDDWGEKLWIFHRKLAERLLKDRPGVQVRMISYIQTAGPPRTFTEFPANTQVMLTGTNEEDIAAWKDHEVPGGFAGYIYNWCPNLGTRYTPMRTLRFVEAQARRLYRAGIHALYRDGPGQLYGLEGPVYYIMGRMFDDPEHNRAADLMIEFCEAAFGNAARPMQHFYDQLYHAIELYSDFLGTRCPAWVYHDIYGRRHKYLSDPFRLIGFLYTPKLLAALETQLAAADRLARAEKVRARLALVRTELEYLKHLAKVVHLDHAYQIAPDRPALERLLDAIDARNAFIASLYDPAYRNQQLATWGFVLFPPPGHDANHLRLAYDRYQEPYSKTPLNWDTAAKRKERSSGSTRSPQPD